MCPICILTAAVFGPGLITACGINWLGKLRGNSDEDGAAGTLTLGLGDGESERATGEAEREHAA